MIKEWMTHRNNENQNKQYTWKLEDQINYHYFPKVKVLTEKAAKRKLLSQSTIENVDDVINKIINYEFGYNQPLKQYDLPPDREIKQEIDEEYNIPKEYNIINKIQYEDKERFIKLKPRDIRGLTPQERKDYERRLRQEQANQRGEYAYNDNTNGNLGLPDHIKEKQAKDVFLTLFDSAYDKAKANPEEYFQWLDKACSSFITKLVDIDLNSILQRVNEMAYGSHRNEKMFYLASNVYYLDEMLNELIKKRSTSHEASTSKISIFILP
jgi:hypothetical protein